MNTKELRLVIYQTRIHQSMHQWKLGVATPLEGFGASASLQLFNNWSVLPIIVERGAKDSIDGELGELGPYVTSNQVQSGTGIGCRMSKPLRSSKKRMVILQWSFLWFPMHIGSSQSNQWFTLYSLVASVLLVDSPISIDEFAFSDVLSYNPFRLAKYLPTNSRWYWICPFWKPFREIHFIQGVLHLVRLVNTWISILGIVKTC